MALRDRKLWFREYRKREEDKKKRKERYERNKERMCAIVVSNARKRKERRASRPPPTACEVCGAVPRNYICFDHCHTTNKFRGWLCNSCNSALGYARDNPDLLRKLAAYLESWDV